MDFVSQKERIIRRNYWLINLRWIAAAGVTFLIIISFITADRTSSYGLLSVFTLLLIHNFISLFLHKRALKFPLDRLSAFINRLMFYQVFTDLILLTLLIHFTGGVESPLLLFYSFHIVITSILFPNPMSYVFAGISVLFVSTLAFLEFNHIMPFETMGIFDFSPHNLRSLVSYILIFTVAVFVLVYMVEDITHQLYLKELNLFQSNQQLEITNAELKRKDSVKDEYVSRVTHDIKGHLAAIQTNLSVLKNNIAGPLSPKQEKFVNLSFNRTEKLTDFVHDLLKVTQMRLNNKIDKECISFNKIINNVVLLLSESASKKSITINLNVEPELKALGNLFSIEEVISNLLQNAIKYTPDNGTVTITALKKDGYAEISVKDNGIGIPANEIKNVFDDFYRASNAYENKQEGSGLGLSIVWQIIERNNGKIWVESELGKGSTFFFSLPDSRFFDEH